MSKIRKALLAATIVPFVLLGCGTASADTIFEAMAKAYANNPDLNAARAGLRATDEGVTIAKAGYRPQIGASLSGTGSWISDIGGGKSFFSNNEDHHVGSATAAFTITQQIFDGFQTLNRVRAAEANVFATRESLRANEMSILLNAAQAYANLARDNQIVQIRKQNMAFLNEQRKAANARLQVGEGTRTDVSLAEAQLAGSQALLASAEAQVKQSEAVYYQIVGDLPRGIKQPQAATKALPKNLDTAVAIGMREHPAVLAAEHSVDVAGYQVKEAEGTMLPGVVVQGQVSRSKFDPDSSNTSTTSSLTARLTVPIYQGGAEYGQVRQAKERLGQQRIQVDSVRMDVQQTIISAYAQMDAARAAIAANKQQIAAATEALNGVIEERNVGQSTTLDVLNAQQNVLDAQESMVQSQRILVVASYSVLAAMGRLTVQSQGLQVAEYHPEENFEAVQDKWFGLRTVDGR